MDFGFLLKKFISFFLHPYGIVFTLFALGLYLLFTKKESYSKISLSLSFILLTLFSYHPFSNYLVSSLENKYPKYDYSQNVKFIHVLGGGHNTDTTQPISSHLSYASTKRVLEGVVIHFNTPNSKLIFTGHKGITNTATATMNAQLAMALGVQKENIIIGEDPKDTKEEAIFTKELLAEEPFVLVTSATHLPRSMKLFQSLGLNPIPAPADFIKKDVLTYFNAPKVGAFQNSNIAVHEYIGILWSNLKD